MSFDVNNMRTAKARLTSRLTGFTLLELSLVVAIVAVVTAVGISVGGSMISSAKQTATNNKLDVIETAMMAYRMANDRLPCPAELDLPFSNVNYGKEAALPGGCVGGTPAAQFTAAMPVDATVVAEGGVPTATLGLPNSFQYDAWNRKIVYAVWTPVTATRAFLNYGIVPSCGDITIRDGGGANRTGNAIYALLSLGPDGHGGYLPNGTRYNAGVSNTDEDANAHYSNLGANTAYTGTYVQKDVMRDASDAINPFQQLVRYKERWQLANMADNFSPNGSLCVPGFRADQPAGNNTAPVMSSVAFGDVNGDGYQDLIIGGFSARPYHGAGNFSGQVYVLFGSPQGFTTPFQLIPGLNGTNGLIINGPIGGGSEIGGSVATANLLNRFNGTHPISDIIIGAPGNYKGVVGGGGVYVIYGGTGNWPASINLNPNSVPPVPNGMTGVGGKNGTKGFRIDGMVAGEAIGWSVGAGKVNGDPIPSILMGGGGGSGGPFYVVFDQPWNSPALFRSSGTAWKDMTAFTLDNNPNTGLYDGKDYGFKIAALAAAGFSPAVIRAGSLNTAGTDDILLGISGLNSAYVVFGQAKGFNWTTTPFDLSTLNGTNGFQVTDIIHTNAQDIAVGDINGDGFNDLVIAATYDNYIFVIFGGGTPISAGPPVQSWPATFVVPTNLTFSTNPTTHPSGSTGFYITGLVGRYACGSTGKFPDLAIGDINGDGVMDIFAGSPGTASSAGAGYVIYGQKPWARGLTFDVSALNGVNGFAVVGSSLAPNANVGGGVALGDFTGAGVPSLAMYAPCYRPNDPYSGSIYLLYGKKSWPGTYNLNF